MCPGHSVPLSLSVSDSPGRHGWCLPTRRHILSASMHLSQREGPPPPIPTPPSYQLPAVGGRTLSQSPGSRPRLHALPARDPQACSFPCICQRVMAGETEGGDAGGRNCLTAWSPPSWFSLASGHVPLIHGSVIHESVSETDVAACRVLRYYYSLSKVLKSERRKTKTTFIFPCCSLRCLKWACDEKQTKKTVDCFS